jgi:hypothetical protein
MITLGFMTSTIHRPKTTTVRIPRDIDAAVRILAVREDRSINKQIAILLREALIARGVK